MIARSEAFIVQPDILGSLVQAVRSDVEDIIAADEAKAAKFLRLSFHDCVGGCDGCVDLTNPKNFGLLEPIVDLRPLVNAHTGNGSPLTRPDIWAVAALTAADVMQPITERIDFRLHHIGRVPCELVFNDCVNFEGVPVNCRDTRGPHREIPGADITTHDLFTFFNDEFGFTNRQTVAIMGAHTIGQLNRDNSGFDGPNGWLLNNDIFDNEYYLELVGGSSVDDPTSIHINGAPPWRRDFEDNNDLDEFGNNFVWTGFPEGRKIIMLNADIAIVRELTDQNMNANGVVDCEFINEGRCPVAQRSFQFAVEYTFDNLLWLRDFREVMNIMLTSRYIVPPGCGVGGGFTCLISLA